MNNNIRYELDPAIVNAAANAYLLLDKKVPRHDILWDVLKSNNVDPMNIAFAEGGLEKLAQMTIAVGEKVEELESVDPQG
jgi:RNAse (barnase) inhibitor barstar